MAGIKAPFLVRTRDEHQRAVELVDVFEKYSDVHRARVRHVVVVEPRAVILVPLPDVAVERGLAVYLELVDVNAVAEDLLRGFDQARMAAEPAVSVVVGMRGEIGAHGGAAGAGNPASRRQPAHQRPGGTVGSGTGAAAGETFNPLLLMGA